MNIVMFNPRAPATIVHEIVSLDQITPANPGTTSPV